MLLLLDSNNHLRKKYNKMGIVLKGLMLNVAVEEQIPLHSCPKHELIKDPKIFPAMLVHTKRLPEKEH